MAKLAKCPYCHGSHRTKRAFNRCRDKHSALVWTKEGDKKRRG